MLERSQVAAPRALTAQRVAGFTESVIREMTRLAHQYNALNLAQGYPGFPAPEAMKRAAIEAIENDINQYAITWGAKRLRDAISAKYQWYQGMDVDPETMITVTCGATEGMMAALLALINPGDEIIVFEPFYENYGPDGILSGATPRYVTLHEPDWSLDPDELAAAFNNHTKAIVLNTPNNPTGKVFTREELAMIAALCQKWDVVAVTDEIYEHIVYEGREHISMATLPGMAERTVTVNGASKTYSVTGWRVGWVIAAPPLTNAIRKVHDFLTVGAPAPLQEGVAVALGFGTDYYAQLARDYRERRDFMLEALTAAGFRCFKPYGAYYVMTDFSAFGFEDDLTFAEYLVKEIGIAAVPGSSFYHDAVLGRQKIRFAYAQPLDILQRAGERLRRLRA
ncbi:MAG: aminotransferase class I/II-fold pyridoxal phosphate-dependent enzyme [Abditibacteriales bacterium]|nr:aminotransferase class I/II-fold pyridoxal phosphate-dependent enzyme [Abditibacteriales bacterium]MDW8366563.1 aminotransferase class I/II-fold pyridoxal phosphate-dependent enzyme [Abditibacteriales bacterium]